MIPILYEKDENIFASNGLGRLRDVTSCVVTEERNGIYECDFEYPVDGAHFDDIQLGRIIGVEHDETNDVQPFDIVGYSRPINGLVTFHCVHISYRQSKMTVFGTNINSLASAFTMLKGAVPSNPFTYWTDKTSTGFMASADGTPYSVRQFLGGMEGSILDAYGGEYEWDKFVVKLWSQRGQSRSLTIRYGVNMLDYTDEADCSESVNAIVPYWKGSDTNGKDVIVRGAMTQSGMPTSSGRVECAPVDFTDKFETKPTTAQLQNMALSYMSSNQTNLPTQTITVDFIRLADSPEYARFSSLQECKLCDTIRVVFPAYKQAGTFKIVKTEYDVLQERFTKMELGELSTGLSEALGISELQQDSRSTIDQIIDRLDALPQIACGHMSVGSVNASSYKDVTITHNLGADANVVASLFTSGTAANIGNTTVSVHDITATTAQVRVFNNRTGSFSPAIEWIAVKL